MHRVGTPDQQHVFQHVHGASFEIGKALVQHRETKAVGFTGSFSGGKALLDYAQQREEPIPVFAEMGSINPVIILPGATKNHMEKIAEQYAASITQSVGQFCTNPGLMLAIKSEDLNGLRFKFETAYFFRNKLLTKILSSFVCQPTYFFQGGLLILLN